VSGVRKVETVRSRWIGAHPAIDMVITVDPDLSTDEAHKIADAIEGRLEEAYNARDVSIHIEPHGS